MAFLYLASVTSSKILFSSIHSTSQQCTLESRLVYCNLVALSWIFGFPEELSQFSNQCIDVLTSLLQHSKFVESILAGADWCKFSVHECSSSLSNIAELLCIKHMLCSKMDQDTQRYTWGLWWWHEPGVYAGSPPWPWLHPLQSVLPSTTLGKILVPCWDLLVCTPWACCHPRSNPRLFQHWYPLHGIRSLHEGAICSPPGSWVKNMEWFVVVDLSQYCREQVESLCWRQGEQERSVGIC